MWVNNFVPFNFDKLNDEIVEILNEMGCKCRERMQLDIFFDSSLFCFHSGKICVLFMNLRNNWLLINPLGILK